MALLARDPMGPEAHGPGPIGPGGTGKITATGVVYGCGTGSEFAKSKKKKRIRGKKRKIGGTVEVWGQTRPKSKQNNKKRVKKGKIGGTVEVWGQTRPKSKQFFFVFLTGVC